MRASIAFLIALSTGCTALRPLEASDGGVDAGMTDAGERDAGGGCVPSGVDRCNGMDDDCDPTTEDGSADPDLGAACDGPDVDVCDEGVLSACTGGALVCDDATGDSLEICGGGDENCDGATDEDGAVGSMTWYSDADLDGYGADATLRMACMQPIDGRRWVLLGGDCDDTDNNVRPGRAENCDTIDNDCDSMIDEAGACPCNTATYGGHMYLFCRRTRGWDSANDDCTSWGYHLIVIETAEENDFALTTAMVDFASDTAWIGLTDPGSGFEWVDGQSLDAYSNWDTSEPSNNTPCGGMRVTSAFGTPGRWHDYFCGANQGYICEAP